jgi:hypothetical protein
MNKTPTGTTTKAGHVPAKASAWMRVNSEFISNDIDESDLQSEKHDEPRN